MKLRRGFKTEANEYSREFRRELGVPAHGPLCPFTLAEHLAIPAMPLSRFVDADPSIRTLLGSDEFFAITVFSGTGRTIVFNDGHHELRQRSDVAHELAHGILGHPPCPPLSRDGCRHFDPDLENEANWLGPALLISEEAALWIARRNMSLDEASQTFNVSKPVLRMRLNVTGAHRRKR